jgi:predicted nucleic acid-binding protein
MPVVVSDTSPLIYLTRLAHFQWLRQLYGEVLIPPAVWREIVDVGAGLPEADETRTAIAQGWVRVQAPASVTAVSRREGLDPGEREALSLAHEPGALLIIDEQVGRRIAAEMGIRVTGTLGILVEAKSRGLVVSVRAELDRLVNETTVYLSDSVRAFVLQQAGEADLHP